MKFFLDIDGVMVHANPHKRVDLDDDGFYKFNQTAVDVLNSVIDPNSDDELILSTSHRFRFNIIEWLSIFQSRGINAKNISILDIPIQHKHTRKSEIIDWIVRCNLTADDLVIIDDDKSLNELPNNLKERLVLTNPYTGLNSSSELKKILRHRKNDSHQKTQAIDLPMFHINR